MKNEIIQLGKTPPEGEHRDAVHVPVIVATAHEHLHPCTHVGLEVDAGDGVITTTAADPVGIIDPFIKSMTNPGGRVIVCL